MCCVLARARLGQFVLLVLLLGASRVESEGDPRSPQAATPMRSAATATTPHDNTFGYAVWGAIGAGLLARQTLKWMRRSRSPHAYPRANRRRRPAAGPAVPAGTTEARPSSAGARAPQRPRSTTIRFDTERPATGAADSVRQASDVRDGVTGQTIDPSRGVVRCATCHVCYQAESFELIEQQNFRRCAACGGGSFAPIPGVSSRGVRASNQETATVTLANYRWMVDQVVVFEGECVAVYPSASGSSYAVMFENARWTDGFKLVIPQHTVRFVGEQYIRNLAGKRIRVRGLIVNDPVYGYEIMLNGDARILAVSA
jgi:hypothetical protein